MMRERFEGERIVLRKARMSDLDAVAANIYCDAELLSTMFLNISRDRAEAESRLARTIAFQKERPLYFVARKDTDEVIGLCGLCEEAEGIWSEAGLAIARKEQGRGFGREMLAILLDYAFRELGARQFVYSCMDTNTRSRNLALSFGFQYESTSSTVREYDQKKFNLERYSLSREAYLNLW